MKTTREETVGSREHPAPAGLLRVFQALVPLFFLIGGMFAPSECTCTSEESPAPLGVLACRSHHPKRTVAPAPATAVKTAAAGVLEGTFSITSTGEARYAISLVAVPGRAGVEPELSLAYDSSNTGSGVLGVGFSIY